MDQGSAAEHPFGVDERWQEWGWGGAGVSHILLEMK